MITQQQILLNRLINHLRLDRRNPGHLRIEMDAIIQLLAEWGLDVPPKQYEELVKKFMRQEVLHKVPLGGKSLFPQIALGLLVLAHRLLEAAEKSMAENIESTPDEIKGLMLDG